MVCFPNAKINIGLNIVEKRSDGFHAIESIFFPIKKLTDVLEILEHNGKEQIVFTNSGFEIPGDWKTNLCVKAYYLINDYVPLPPIKFHLHKHIPMGAGLGGGSSNAVFFMKIINEKFNLKLSENTQLEIASNLGSDCSFFLQNTSAFVSGRGEICESIPLDLGEFKIGFVHPNIHISTSEAFSKIVPHSSNLNLRNEIQKPLTAWKDTIENEFETITFQRFPQLLNIKNELYRQGAVYASMSGSGSSLYGIFKKSHFEKPIFENQNIDFFDLV